METKLLNAMYGYARTSQTRMTALEGNDAGLAQRLAIIEDRLIALERRPSPPPPAGHL